MHRSCILSFSVLLKRILEDPGKIKSPLSQRLEVGAGSSRYLVTFSTRTSSASFCNYEYQHGGCPVLPSLAQSDPDWFSLTFCSHFISCPAVFDFALIEHFSLQHLPAGNLSLEEWVMGRMNHDTCFLRVRVLFLYQAVSRFILWKYQTP